MVTTTTTTIILPPSEAVCQELLAIDNTKAIGEPKEVDCPFIDTKLPSSEFEKGSENLKEPLVSDIPVLRESVALEEEEVEPCHQSSSDIKRRPQEKDHHSSDWKRLKIDSKPAAMAIGERLKRKSDDEEEEEDDEIKNLWLLQPAENEPPSSSNNNPAFASYPRPEDDTDNEDDDKDDRHSKNSKSSQVKPTNATIVKFQGKLKKQGLELVEQDGDGNCLFRAVSLQVYGNADNHGEVRERCMDYIAGNEEHYSNFIVAASADEEDCKSSGSDSSLTPFQAYVARKRRDGIHGNHAEIQAISELFNRPVEVYTPDNPDGKPMNIFHSEYKTSDPPIRLSYHDGNHYNAIVDPLVPTAGLGLGLPGLQPGLADKLQLAKAKAESDQLADDMELQRVLKESQEEYKDFQQDSLQRALKESSYDLDYVSRKRRNRTTDHSFYI